jgi:hypothetical protein
MENKDGMSPWRGGTMGNPSYCETGGTFIDIMTVIQPMV